MPLTSRPAAAAPPRLLRRPPRALQAAHATEPATRQSWREPLRWLSGPSRPHVHLVPFLKHQQRERLVDIGVVGAWPIHAVHKVADGGWVEDAVDRQPRWLQGFTHPALQVGLDP